MVATRVAFLLGLALLLPRAVSAQEVLLPLQTAPQAPRNPSAKATIAPLTLPFFDDFAGGSLRPEHWQQQSGAQAETGDRLLPPTVGVATLDALDAEGNLYSGASTSLFPADTLESLPLRLDSLTVADSVVLSFYYLPGGGKGNLWERVGDAPEEEDSLFLEFYRAADSAWVTVWARGGTTVDSLLAATGREWQYVALPLTDSAYFDSTFRFRFRNYCSLQVTSKPGLAGNSDYWHLDYIYVDSHRAPGGDPESRDVAFVAGAPSMLASYRAMPARQYRASEMADSLTMVIGNLFSSELATKYTYSILGPAGETLYSYDGGYENTPPFLLHGEYQQAPSHARPEVGYSFPESATPCTYTVVHAVREGVAGDDYPANDTVRYRQVFDNYYAYDDGTAENGYGLTSTASRVYLAYRFDLITADTLMAVDLYLNRTLEDGNELVPFKLMVWSNEGGQPGTVLYRDEASRMPAVEGLNRFHRYLLERGVVVDGSVFVGFEQQNNYYINLGFDRSFNTSDRIYYLTGTAWQQSILSGSLMLRPCFGVAAVPVGIEERGAERGEWRVWPNPASEWVSVEGMTGEGTVSLYDMTGRQVATAKGNSLSVAGLPNGVYVVRCTGPQSTVSIKKLIVKH